MEVELWVFRWTFFPSSTSSLSPHLKILGTKTTFVDSGGWVGVSLWLFFNIIAQYQIL